MTSKLKEMGYNPAPSMLGEIAFWRSWYVGYSEEFHKYGVWNGYSRVDCRRLSAGMGKKVCEDWADLLLNEKVGITISGEAEQAFVDSVLEENNFRVKGNEMQERKAALGTVAYVLHAVGARVDDLTGKLVSADRIKMNYCLADQIHPLYWENGRIVDCAFSNVWQAGNKEYTYLQIHHLVNGLYDIENYLFLGAEEIPLDSVAAYQNVSPIVHTASDRPQFVIDRLNIANTDADSPMGLSVLANAIDQLKGVDIAYDSYVNEFVLGKKRVMVKPETMKSIDGRPVFDPNELVYYVLPEDTADGVLIEQVDMTLRTQEHNAGMQDMLNLLSSKCGFGEHRYRYDRGNISTATQVISENSTLFRTLKKHELILRDALISLCRIILRMGNSYMGLSLNEDADIAIDFDDSIIEDKTAERNNDRQDLAAGIMNDWEYRMKWYNEDEATAKKMLPGMEKLTTEEQDEVE